MKNIKTWAIGNIHRNEHWKVISIVATDKKGRLKAIPIPKWVY